MKWRIFLVLISISVYSDSITTEYLNQLPLPRKKSTVIIYMSAANDLWPYADRNIEQMKKVGSTEHLNILVHRDMRKPGYQKITQRFFIQKYEAIQIGPNQALDSGDEKTLIDTVLWAESQFPAEHLIIIFWNHGSGDLNPLKWRATNPSRLFTYNTTTKQIELDRTLTIPAFIDETIASDRGVCFDETTGNYLNDQKLITALSTIIAHRGKKIDVLFFDACLMAGVGTAWIVHPYADYMIASEELVLGTGADYSAILLPLATGCATPLEWCRHVVASHEKTYTALTQDYTESALDLKKFPLLHNNIDAVARCLTEALAQQSNGSVAQLLHKSRNKFACTHFGDNEPNYIDLLHFYRNLLKNSSSLLLSETKATAATKAILRALLLQGIRCIKECVIANVAGTNLKKAGGISIYFPTDRLHPSFMHTEFARHNAWGTFLHHYSSKKHAITPEK